MTSLATSSCDYSPFPQMLRPPYTILQRIMVLEGVSVMVAKTDGSVNSEPHELGAARLSRPQLQRYSQQGEAPHCEALLESMEDQQLFCFGVESKGKLLSFSWFHIGSASADMNYGRTRATATALELEPSTAFVFHAYTAEEARGRRLLTRVLEHAGVWLRQHRCVTHLVATTELINDSARRAFANAGFQHADSYWRFGFGSRIGARYPAAKSPVIRYGVAEA